MIIRKIEKIDVIKSYDETGGFISDKTKYTYKPILIWQDVIIGILLAIAVFIQVI